MKIKTITCHDVYNAGASLQAYALMKYLQSLGHEVEIINYKPDYLSGHYSLTNVSRRYRKPFLREAYVLAKLPGRLKARLGKRKKEYDAFTQNYLNLTEKRYTSNEELKADTPKADVYFAGSDQIWNTFFRNGKDPAFYLDFAPEGAVKASYAASFATEDVAEGYREKVKLWLSGLDYISVRENSGVDIIEKMGISGAVRVLDPVFLLGKEEWTAAITQQFQERYILVYDFDNSKKIQTFVQDMAKKNYWKIYSVLPCSYADRCFSEEGPLGFLNLVYSAQYVVSNSFHATAFSLIFQKPFAVFDRQEKISTRMQDLVKLFGLKQVNDANSVMTIRAKLEQEIRNSKEYIDKVLKGAKRT